MQKKIYFALTLLVLGELAFGASARKYVKTSCFTPAGASVYRDRFGDYFVKNVVRGEAFYFPAERSSLVDAFGTACR